MVEAFKGESTDPAGIRSLSGVGSLVDLQDVGPGEALVTHAAPVWFLLRVDAPVQFEVPQAAELVPTQRAAIGFVSSLAASVPPQLTEGRVAFPAVAAQVQTLPLVYALVDLQVAGLRELLPTLVADVGSGDVAMPMTIQVCLKRNLVWETDHTLRASMVPVFSVSQHSCRSVVHL